jgi:hypothetical protein
MSENDHYKELYSRKLKKNSKKKSKKEDDESLNLDEN